VNELEGIKAGDQVHVSGGWEPGTIARVERVTPSGRIVVNGMQYRADGRPCGAGAWRRSHLSPVTPDVMEEMERDRLVDDALRLWERIKPTRNDSVAMLKHFIEATRPIAELRESGSDRPQSGTLASRNDGPGP